MRKHPIYESPKMRAPTAKTPYYTIEIRKPLQLGNGKGNRLPVVPNAQEKLMPGLGLKKQLRKFGRSLINS